MVVEVIVAVVGPVIVTVHLNGNATVGVIRPVDGVYGSITFEVCVRTSGHRVVPCLVGTAGLASAA